jgi:hypothetical protein
MSSGSYFPPPVRRVDTPKGDTGSEARAQELRLAFEKRLAECRLRLHPDKTKIVYCKDANRKEPPERAFDFLGYTFRPRLAINRRAEHFVSFVPAVTRKLPSKCDDVCAPGDCIGTVIWIWTPSSSGFALF